MVKVQEVIEYIYKQIIFDSYFHFIRWLNVQVNNGNKPVFRFDGFERVHKNGTILTRPVITVRKESLK